MLEELGHARTVAQGDRKVYEITDEGRRDLEAHSPEIAEFYEGNVDYGWEEHADDVAQIMARVGRVMRLLKMSMRRGGLRPSTMRKIRAVLDEALGKLEDLLTPEDT
jgi:DNA-binding PadR family transcriptional regulator